MTESKNPFIQIRDRFVNLKNITSIVELIDENKLVYNFNYSVKFRDPDKYVSDYIYSDIGETTQMVKDLCFNEYIQKNFVILRSRGFFIVNKDLISSFKMDIPNLKIIINFSHSVSVRTPNVETSSDFLYIRFEDVKSLRDNFEKFRTELGV